MTTSPQKIGVTTATIVGMNAMIGAGIFSIPTAIASHVGPASILAFIFVVISIWFMAISIARLAALFPQEGSFYIYTKQWAGHLGGMTAVSAYLTGLLIAMGLLCKQAGIYLNLFIPSIDPYILGILILGILVVINMFGIKLSQLGQQILIACTLFPLIATIILCFSKANLLNLLPFAPYGFTNVMKATRIVIFSFFGFECAASLFNIVENPAKNVPKALAYSIIFVGIIYTLFVSSIILALPTASLTNPHLRVSDILLMLFPESNWMIRLIDFSILSAIVGTVHSMIWSSSNLWIDIVKKMRNPWAHCLLRKNIINTYTSVLTMGICILLSYLLLENMNAFFNLTALCIVFAYITSMITLLTIKQKWKNQQNIQTVIGLITATAIFIFALEGIINEII